MVSNGSGLKLPHFNFGFRRRSHSNLKDVVPTGPPKLPFEILEPIFIIASTEDRSCILRFARVSKDVSTWVLPILYTTLYLPTKSLSRLIRKFQSQQKHASSKLKPLHLLYPTTSLIITGPPPDLWWLTFFTKRFPDLRRIAFETTGRTEPTHVGGLFWQILAEVNGPQVVAFRLPLTAYQVPTSNKRFGGFGTPHFQNTTNLALNWMTLRHFHPLPTGVKINDVFPVLRYLFIQGVEGGITDVIALLNGFAQLETVKRISITLEYENQYVNLDINLFMRSLADGLQPYGEKVMLSDLKGWDIDPIFEKNPMGPDYFDALDEVWKEMNGGRVDTFVLPKVMPPKSDNRVGFAGNQIALLVKTGAGTLA